MLCVVSDLDVMVASDKGEATRLLPPRKQFGVASGESRVGNHRSQELVIKLRGRYRGLNGEQAGGPVGRKDNGSAVADQAGAGDGAIKGTTNGIGSKGKTSVSGGVVDTGSVR